MTLVVALAVVAMTACDCTAAHLARDGGGDAATDAGLEPCSPAIFALGRPPARLCRDPLAGNPEDFAADGLPWLTSDAIAPVNLRIDGESVVLDAMLAHRPAERISKETPVLLGARVRYRLRLDGNVPFGALEEATPIDPVLAVDEVRATTLEADCGAADSGQTGRLLCTSSGRWDVWVHAARTDFESPFISPGLTEPTVLAVLLVDRESRVVWWLGLQGLPDACEHDPTVIPDVPCAPPLDIGGAYASFAVPGGPTEVVDPYAGHYCPLELSCVRCCAPASHVRYECWDRGFCRGDVPAGWLGSACAAMTLDEVPAPAAPPCPMPLAEPTACVADVEEPDCP